MDYPYNNQNPRRGEAYRVKEGPNGKMLKERVDAGHTRTITDQHTNIQGVLYHPGTKLPNSKRSGALHPSQEVFRSRTFGPSVGKG